MNDTPDDKPTSGSRDSPDDARRKLAQNWAAMTAAMVSPEQSQPSSRKPAQPPPLPLDQTPSNVRKLPLPMDAAPDAAPPAGAAPTTPAQPQPPPPAAAPPPTPSPAPAPAQPTAPAPATAPAPPVSPAEHLPATPQPRLAPVSPAPVSGAASGSTAPARAVPSSGSVEALSGPVAQTVVSDGVDDDPAMQMAQNRNNLTIAVSFTIFAVVVAMGMTFASQYSTNPAGSDGSGTLIATGISIGLAWAIALSQRVLGRFWTAWLIVPLAVLLLGPFLSGLVWMRNQEALARSYLSQAGAGALIDADANTLASTTVYDKAGCFMLVRNRNTKQTTVSVAGAAPATARQHADLALAPRFAAHVPAGGATSLGHVFDFPSGAGPPLVETPERPPLDCGA